MLARTRARRLTKSPLRAAEAIDWRERASCKDWPGLKKEDPWFPDRPSEVDAYAEARAVCAGCPVAETCLEFALGDGNGRGMQRWGVYAGTTPEERAAMIRRRKKQEQKERRAG